MLNIITIQKPNANQLMSSDRSTRTPDNSNGRKDQVLWSYIDHLLLTGHLWITLSTSESKHINYTSVRGCYCKYKQSLSQLVNKWLITCNSNVFYSLLSFCELHLTPFHDTIFVFFWPEYHWRDLSSWNAHLVHQNWYCISFTYNALLKKTWYLSNFHTLMGKSFWGIWLYN
jgi:hypothetical protein